MSYEYKNSCRKVHAIDQRVKKQTRDFLDSLGIMHVYFQQEQKKRKESDRIMHPIDKGFIEALQYGLKPCAGIAIGFDRLAAIFANVSSLEETQVITISTV